MLVNTSYLAYGSKMVVLKKSVNTCDETACRGSSIFFLEHNAPLATVLINENVLASLAEIFNKSKEMNLFSQEKTATVFVANAKVSVFKRKHELGGIRETKNICFPLRKSFLNENKIKIQEKMQKIFQLHFKGLIHSFENYYPTAQELDDFMCVENVYSVNQKPFCLNLAEYEVLINLTTHSELKISIQN